MSVNQLDITKHFSLLDGKLVKGGWVAPPNARYSGVDYLTDEVFQDVKASGVNLLFGVIYPNKEFDDLVRFIDLCEKYGLYTVIPEEELVVKDCDVESIIRRIEYYKTRKCVVGINLKDEPGYEHIPIFKENMAKIRPHLGHLITYINHMPMYATDTQIFGGEYHFMQKEITKERYAEFLEGYCKEVGEDILSYDFYPFRHEKGIIDPKYYNQLALFYDFAQKYDKPFWNFTQVTSWSRGCIRNMTYSEIEWLNNTSIASGVGGIAYFCYWTPKSNDESFESAMIDEKGNKTISYYFVQRANERLDYAMAYLKDAEYVGAIPYGDTMALYPEDSSLREFGDLASTRADGVLIGCFKEGEKNRYYVVNTSVFEARVVDLHFKKSVDVLIVDGGEKKSFVGDTMVITIGAGQAVVVVDK